MALSALVLQVLVSGPSDFPSDHRDTIHSTIRAWNAAYGRHFGIVFNPVDWQESASPGAGEYPQAVLNEQIVDSSDAAIVVLTDRMGTPTPDHPSGTAEEVERLLGAGKEVAVYINNCLRSPARGPEAGEQLQALERFVQSLQKRAFTGGYATKEELRVNLGNLLPRVASKFRLEADAAIHSTEPAGDELASPVASGDNVLESEYGVWPRIEVTESPATDRKGRLRTKRRWRLVLESTIPRAVQNVRHWYEDSEGNPVNDFSLREDRNSPIETLGPRGSADFTVIRALGSPSQAICVVEWVDQGEVHSTRATVRTS